MAKILVIDDDPSIRIFIKTALNIEGHEVELKENALEGLAFMRTGEIPDLVVTDLLMDVMGGSELINAMREDYQLRDIPAIIITGCIPMPGVLPEENKFQGLLIKPFDLDDFLETVARLTRKEDIDQVKRYVIYPGSNRS